jgi:hypothetical protein
MKRQIRNKQIDKIKSSDLERLPHREKYDSTIEERERGYEGRKPEPRLKEYR